MTEQEARREAERRWPQVEGTHSTDDVAEGFVLGAAWERSRVVVAAPSDTDREGSSVVNAEDVLAALDNILKPMTTHRSTHLPIMRSRLRQLRERVAQVSTPSQPVQVEVTDRPELPEGAEYFPDEGGIQYQGRVYYPADYVLTRSDIAALRVKTLTDAADEVEAIIALGEQAETVAFPPGTTGLSEAIERRDSLYEEPAAWLRARAAALGVPVSPESEGKK